MNKNIKLAVAGAVLALSASAANAGIIIPAGEWTIDINGNVNAYVNSTSLDPRRQGDSKSQLNMSPAGNSTNIKSLQTGLLPAWLGITGKTRQNDLDVEWTISMQPGVSSNDITGDGATSGRGTAEAGTNNSTFLNRQTYLSFGDKSWGSIKLGKDLGIFASDAILNDMTLLGVGSGGGLNSKINSTNGGIGTGYIYAAWKAQVAYTTPNFNGFQATVGITNPNQVGTGSTSATVSTTGQGRYGLEGKASYSFTANDVTGKIWASGASYSVSSSAAAASYNNVDIWAGDIGANINVAGLGLTGYYYTGEGAGATFFGTDGVDATGRKRDSDGGYVQATYVLPFKTKIGAAWGISSIDKLSTDTASALVKDQERWTVGAYHPLTKHLNLVAEYSDIKLESHSGVKNEYSNASLGAILFF